MTSTRCPLFRHVHPVRKNARPSRRQQPLWLTEPCGLNLLAYHTCHKATSAAFMVRRAVMSCYTAQLPCSASLHQSGNHSHSSGCEIAAHLSANIVMHSLSPHHSQPDKLSTTCTAVPSVPSHARPLNMLDRHRDMGCPATSGLRRGATAYMRYVLTLLQTTT